MQVGLVLRRATWGARFKARSGSRLPMLISVQQLRRLMIAPSSLFWGVTEGYVCLALLKQIWVIDNPSTICPYPGHFGFVRRAANLHIKREDRNKG